MGIPFYPLPRAHIILCRRHHSRYHQLPRQISGVGVSVLTLYLEQTRSSFPPFSLYVGVTIDDAESTDQNKYHTVRLTSTGNPFSGNQEFRLAPDKMLVEQVKKIRSLTRGMV